MNNEERTCEWCWWHDWHTDKCSQWGHVILCDGRDKICDRHQTSEEYYHDLFMRIEKKKETGEQCQTKENETK